MNWIFKIAPRELKLIDVYLREQYPWIWATRIHFTLYAMILLGAFAALIGVITPLDVQDPMSSSGIMTFFGIFMFPTIIFMGYMIFQLCLFSVEKRKGKSSFFRPLIVFPLMMFSVLSPLVMPFTVSFVLNTRVANLAEVSEVNHDGVELEKAKYFVNSGEDDYRYFATEKEYIRYWEGEDDQYTRSRRNEIRKKIYFHEGRYKHERPRLYKSKSYRSYDNYYKYYTTVNPSTDITEGHLKQFFHDQNLDFDINQAKISLEHLNSCIEKYTKRDFIEVETVLSELEHNIYSDCYSNTRPFRTVDYYNYEKVVSKRFNIASRHLSNIRRAQNNYFPRNADDIFVGFLWAGFIITLLLYIFKLVHWKQFLLSVLVIGIYLTLIGIIEGVGDFDGDFFPIMAIGLVVVSIVFLNKVWQLNKFSVVINQMSIVAFLALPFFPVMILGYLAEILDIFEIPYFDKYLIESPNTYRPYSEAYYDLIDLIWLITFWSGIILFYLIGLPYLKKVFLRLMSLPKKN